MSDARAEQIAQLKQSIASLENTQRAMNVDLSASLQPLRDLLASLESAPSSASTAVSGGIAAQAETIDIGGDAVGRDKIEQHTTSTQYTATNTGSGSIAQGEGAMAAGAGGVAAHEVHGLIITGSHNQVTQIDRQEIHPLPPSPTEIAGDRYLSKLALRCNVLPLAALGGDEGTGDEISLDQVYVALDTRARVPLTKEEQAKRREQVRSGRDENDRPLSAWDSATQTKRLVLLGDPGSGKSTFVRELAAKIIAARQKPGEPLSGWETDLLPVLVSLRELAPRLSNLALDRLSVPERERALLTALWDQFRADLKALNAADFADGLDDTLTHGSVLLIFDGLDEVPERERRTMRAAVKVVLNAYPRLARVIVTSRIRSYTGEAVLPGFTAQTLAPFNEDRIKQFIAGWYTAQVNLGRIDRDKAADRVDDLQSAALRDDLRELSSNPMLLTTMAIIHQSNVGLPRERVRLYKRAVEVLLSRWQSRKGIAVSAELDAVLTDDLKMRAIVERLAYEVHRAQAQSGKAANLARKDVLALLEDRAYLGTLALADQFLDYVDQRAGLLLGLGGDGGSHPSEYNFPHRTFQEYLAGCCLISGRGISREYRERAREGDFWYLAARLGAEELYYNRRSTEALLDLAYDLCPVAEPQSAADWRSVIWSGHMAVLVGADDIRRDTEKADGGQRYLDRLLPRLEAALQGNDLGPIERAEAGRVLGRLGDPRLEVMTVDAMQFCFVPRGDFIMGEGQEKDSEHINKTLNYDYWISQHPITNAQFATFIEADGYRERRYWAEAEAALIWQRGQIHLNRDEEIRERFADFGDPFNLPNHPVVDVTWYEALAFTRWLTDTWHAQHLLPEHYKVRLPSEAEWEKAARGGIEIPTSPIIGRIAVPHKIVHQRNELPKRGYPWGDAFDLNRANYGATQIGSPSAVGVFELGASPYGVLDLSGNVWEWTRSLYRDYPYDSKDGREDLSSTEFRVMRGGAYADSERDMRCAVRDQDLPEGCDVSRTFRLVVSPF